MGNNRKTQSRDATKPTKKKKKERFALLYRKLCVVSQVGIDDLQNISFLHLVRVQDLSRS